MGAGGIAGGLPLALPLNGDLLQAVGHQGRPQQHEIDVPVEGKFFFSMSSKIRTVVASRGRLPQGIDVAQLVHDSRCIRVCIQFIRYVDSQGGN